jgi:hypothetical protein
MLPKSACFTQLRYESYSECELSLQKSCRGNVSIRSIYLSIFPPIYLSVHPSIPPTTHLSVCPSIHTSVCPSVCPSIHHLSIFLSICQSLYRSIYLYIYHLYSSTMCQEWHWILCISSILLVRERYY